MRLRLLLAPLCAAILGSCAYQGTIVQKDATPLPFDQSYGLDGSYAFLLRDNAGALHRQIVTAEVYNGYAIGEYFNDLEPRRATDGKSFDGKTVMTAMMSKVTTRRSLATRTPTQKAKVAKATKAKKSDVKVAKQTRPSIKPKQPTRVATAVAEPARRALPVEKPIELPSKLLNPRPVWDSDLAYVSVPRCR